MFTHQISIGSGRTLSNIFYIAERTDGRTIMFSPSKNTIKVLTTEELSTHCKDCQPIPDGIVAGSGKPLKEMVMESFQEKVVSTAFYPEEWELKK